MTFQAKPPTPIDRQTFRKKIYAYFIVQPIILIAFFSIQSLGVSQARIDLQLYGLIFLILASLLVMTQFKKYLYGRLLDIYPNLPPKKHYWIGWYGACSLTWILLLSFLFLKKSGIQPEKPPSSFLYKPMPILALLTLLVSIPAVFGGLYGDRSPRALDPSYWLSDPTLYRLASLAVEIRLLERVTEAIQNAPEHSSPIPVYQQLQKTYPSSGTGIVLMVASTTKQEAKNLKNSGKMSKSDATLSLLHNLVSILEIWDQTPATASTFNLLTLFSPSNSFEAGLVSAIDWITDYQFQTELIPHINTLMQKAGETTTSRDKILNLHRRLEASRKYREYIASKATWIGL